MRTQILKYWNKIDPRFHGIILFVIFLLASNYFWELTVIGDEDETTFAVTFLGLDITAPFRFAAFAFACVTHNLLSLLGLDNQLVNNAVFFPNGHSTHIVAGCAALKQLFIAICILAFSRGHWKHKLWYIPLSLLILIGFNILRLTFLAFITRDHYEMFDFFHLYVVKYLFYATILLLWLIWDERLRKL